MGGEVMYCKYCGEHNIGNQTYCQKCGRIIKTNTISLEETVINENKKLFCEKCGTELSGRYCTECGDVGYNFELKNKKGIKVPNIGINVSSIDDMKLKIKDSPLGEINSIDDIKDIITTKPIIKSSFISALKLLGIGLLISLLLFAAITKIDSVENFLQGIDDAASSIDNFELSKIKPNFVDLFNISLQSPINISANFKGKDSGDKISVDSDMIIYFRFLILLMIPVIAVIIGNRKLFKDEKSSSEKLLEYGITSLIFSVMVKIIAVINQKVIKISDPDSQFNFTFKISFHDLWSLISIFLIIFAIQIIISMIVKKDNPFTIFNIKRFPDLGNRIMMYIKSMALHSGIISVSMVVSALFILIKNDAKFITSLLAGVAILPGMFINSWLLSFGYDMNISVTNQRTTTMNIWKIWDYIGKIDDIMYKKNSSAIWGYVFISLVLIGLIYVIYKVVKDIEKEDYFVKLGFIAGEISIINMLISLLAGTVVKVNNKVVGNIPYDLEDILYEFNLDFLSPLAESGGIKQVYPLMSIILVSIIWVFAIGTIIYYLKDNKIYHNVASFIDRNNFKIIAVYSALVLISFYLVQSQLLNDFMYNIFHLFPMFNYFL